MDLVELLRIIGLSLVEGLTEFIPVSSTGHLILVGDFLTLKTIPQETFEICIQLGAILAVVNRYWSTCWRLLKFKESGSVELSQFGGQRGIVSVVIACIPAFVLGFLFHDYIKEHLFSAKSVAIALIVGGILLIVVRDKKSPDEESQAPTSVTPVRALVIGLMQCLSLWPGFSRAGATMIGGLVSGLNKKSAAEFSFLLAVPVIGAAVAFDLLKSYKDFNSSSWLSLGIGLFFSYIFALFAIQIFLKLLQRFSLAWFGVYRILLGLLVLMF